MDLAAIGVVDDRALQERVDLAPAEVVDGDHEAVAAAEQIVVEQGAVDVDRLEQLLFCLVGRPGVDSCVAGEWGDDEFFAALEVLDAQISSGQIRQVKGNSYAEDLVSGDALAVIGWSGDITVLNFENEPRWEFVLPEAGGTLWSDNLMIPVGSPYKANAEALIDFYYDPEVAAEVAAYVNYICPVEGAREAMEAIDPELVENELIFPTDATLERAHVFRALTPEEETRYNDEFQAVIGN